MHTLIAEPLTKAGFASFGEVIEADCDKPVPINAGSSVRFMDLAKVEVKGDVPVVGIVRAQPFALPLDLVAMERHPFGSQMFFPVNGARMLVVAAADPNDFASYRGFVTNGAQGVSYNANVWHHPLAVLDQTTDLIVVDRTNPDANLEKVDMPFELRLDLAD